jgi:osmotically-inducible protein OsmY
MQLHTTPRTLTVIAAAAMALALGACSRNDERTAGEKLDSAIAKTEQKADEIKAEVKQEAAEAKAATEAATDKMAAKVESAGEKMADSVSDAAITASINGELAKDPKLSALRIDVDTTNGRVLLSGKAPDSTSRDRATSLAYAVKGVTSVENRLQIGG